MKTAYEDSLLLAQVNSLTEIEFEALLLEMGKTIERNKWNHIIENVFELDSKAELMSAESEIEYQKERADEAFTELKELKSKLRQINDLSQ